MTGDQAGQDDLSQCREDQNPGGGIDAVEAIVPAPQFDGAAIELVDRKEKNDGNEFRNLLHVVSLIAGS